MSDVRVGHGEHGVTYDPKQHHRRSIRLWGRDYAEPGAYFVTICVGHHKCLFGRIEGEQMRLNELGRIVEQTWHGLPNHYCHLELDAFVIMPNHIHMVILLTDVGAGLKPAPTTKRHGLSEIVRAFKTFSSRRINDQCGTPGISIWQRNYYEHVIRTETTLNHIRRYVADNPLRWAFDPDNPDAVNPDRAEPWRVQAISRTRHAGFCCPVTAFSVSIG